MDWNWLDWAAAAVLGGAVGASELISRYKDHPGAAIKTWPAGVYIAINGTASAGALGLIHINGWFGPPAGRRFSWRASARWRFSERRSSWCGPAIGMWV
jgi:hypothetical protein